MKKIKYKKIFIFVLWIIGISSLITLLGFVDAEQKKVKGKSINVIVTNESENSFVDETVVLRFLKDKKDTIVNQTTEDLSIVDLEKALNAHPAIEKADVSIDLNGSAEIKVTQRRPIVRVLNSFGEYYYIDEKGKLMPLSDNYSARVPFVNGNIFEKYGTFYNMNFSKIDADTALAKICILDDVYQLSKIIDNDSLLSSLVQQIYINKNKEIEIYTTIGGHKIIFGNSDEATLKFEKLKLFYRDGLNSINAWNRYSIVNLKYKNQIVCTKK